MFCIAAANDFANNSPKPDFTPLQFLACHFVAACVNDIGNNATVVERGTARKCCEFAGGVMLLRYPQKMCLRTGTTSCAFATIAQTVCKGAPPKRVIRTQRSKPDKSEGGCILHL